MAKKDFTVNENQDRHPDDQQAAGRKPLPSAANDASEKEKPHHETDVKNAHATGDGSFGRSESSLPENEEEANAADSPY